MNWGVWLAQMVLEFGPAVVPLAERLWKLATSGAAPTQADWDELKALGNQTATSQMRDMLVRAGIPLDSPQAIALLALTVPKTP